MMWRLHAQRLLVERGQKDVVPQLDRARAKQVGRRDRAERRRAARPVDAARPRRDVEPDRLKRDAPRSRRSSIRRRRAEGGGDGAAEDRGIGQCDRVAAGLLQDADLHTRLAVVLALADVPASPEVGRLLYKASADSRDTYGDRWLSRAMFIAADRHRAGFLAEYKGRPQGRSGRLTAGLAPHRRDQA